DDPALKPPVDTAPGQRSAGGGSIDPGESKASPALAAKPVRTSKPVSVAQKTAPERQERPAPTTARQAPAAEPVPAEVAEEVDLFALESMLASESGKDAVALRTRPEAERTFVTRSAAAAPQRVRPTTTSQSVADSGAFGMGKGKGGRSEEHTSELQ